MENVLNLVGLAHLSADFATEEVTVDMVPDLSDKTLSALGVSKFADRVKLRKYCNLFVENVILKDDSTGDLITAIKRLQCAHFTIKEMSAFLSVSPSTIFRAMSEHKLRKKDNRTLLTESEIDSRVHECACTYPFWGISMITAHFVRLGLDISRQQIRDSMKRVDPTGLQFRKRKVLKRRVYSVPAPNKLWHIDGNEKLKVWGFYVHGCIDGYSRFPIYIKVALNKLSSTVLNYFVLATEEFGVPSRVRIDKGRENVGVAHFMLSHPQRGTDRGSCLSGPSTRNQRIERFWRDVFEKCLVLFHSTFSQLEVERNLDLNNIIDILALQYTYLPSIQHNLNVFSDTWKCHKMRTAGNLSPCDMYNNGPTDHNSSTNGAASNPEDSSDSNWTASNDTEQMARTLPADIGESLRQLYPENPSISVSLLRAKYLSVKSYLNTQHIP